MLSFISFERLEISSKFQLIWIQHKKYFKHCNFRENRFSNNCVLLKKPRKFSIFLERIKISQKFEKVWTQRTLPFSLLAVYLFYVWKILNFFTGLLSFTFIAIVQNMFSLRSMLLCISKRNTVNQLSPKVNFLQKRGIFSNMFGI